MEMDDRREFERIKIPESARIYVRDSAGKKIGVMHTLGRGGMMVDCPRELAIGTRLKLTLADDVEGHSCEVTSIVRYKSDGGYGCEFEKLDVESAVEIGVWMGRFYSYTEQDSKSRR